MLNARRKSPSSSHCSCSPRGWQQRNERCHAHRREWLSEVASASRSRGFAVSNVTRLSRRSRSRIPSSARRNSSRAIRFAPARPPRPAGIDLGPIDGWAHNQDAAGVCPWASPCSLSAEHRGCPADSRTEARATPDCGLSLHREPGNFVVRKNRSGRHGQGVHAGWSARNAG